MISPSTRNWIYNSVASTASITLSGAWMTGRVLWATTSTVLLIGVPFMILWHDDMEKMALEQELRMREMGAEVLTGGQGGAGTEQQSTADRVGAALNADRSLSEPRSVL
jgi:import receptor subunit TOM22